MKKIWITIGFCLSSLLLSAQVDIDLMGGTSKADRSFRAFQATWVGARGFRAGVQVHNGDYQYRFIDARAVNGGNVTETRLILRFPLAVQEKSALMPACIRGSDGCKLPLNRRNWSMDLRTLKHLSWNQA